MAENNMDKYLITLNKSFYNCLISARKKQTEKLKKLSKLKADSVASSVDDDGIQIDR